MGTQFVAEAGPKETRREVEFGSEWERVFGQSPGSVPVPSRQLPKEKWDIVPHMADLADPLPAGGARSLVGLNRACDFRPLCGESGGRSSVRLQHSGAHPTEPGLDNWSTRSRDSFRGCSIVRQSHADGAVNKPQPLPVGRQKWAGQCGCVATVPDHCIDIDHTVRVASERPVA